MEQSQLMQRARQLLEQGNFAQSLSAYQELTRHADTAAEGYYGVGYIKLKSNDLDAAAVAFRRCLKANPNHSNSAYFLGVIAEKENQPDIAQAYYERAVSINPQHREALKKIRPPSMHAVAPRPEEAPPHREESTPLPIQMSAAGPGFYGILQNDRTPLARQAVQLIDSLRMTVRPRLSAYFGRFVLTLLGLPVILVVLTFIAISTMGIRFLRFPEDVLIATVAIAAIFAILMLLILIIRIKSRLISFDQGRIQIADGVFGKNVQNIELYRIVDLSLHQTLWNRLTRDGSLILSIEGHSGHQKLRLRGLAKKDRLDEIYTNLRNAVLLLRSGNWGKGVIY